MAGGARPAPPAARRPPRGAARTASPRDVYRRQGAFAGASRDG